MKAVIIEDEHLIAQELKYKIASVAPDVQVEEILPSLKTARKWFMQNAEPDLMFMDVQLSDGVSFDLFEEFNFKCPVIFTTAYNEYAIKAFKTNGIDYLLKPIAEEELKIAIEKGRMFIGAGKNQPIDLNAIILQIAGKGVTGTSQYKERIIVNIRNNWIPINTSEIAYFMRDNLNYLHTFKGDKYIVDFQSLDEVEEIIDPSKFFRANRQFIINIDAIEKVQPNDNQKLTVFLKAPSKLQVDISREKAPAFKKWLDN
ncbi:LytTR family DNA-binding domain-containing protein [Flavihumibacter rivuli]|uniref:LytR/AlgR family response regulator transcription factor n=1 Tax=Flavihumibacter rivuli TaxID=2838156 RepID=UPI001BDEFDFD|nr:LytTR family DNA-binding domain-containing protein [Flavihumibacter rivuli]ULQ56718.1 LytTR family DNA-binding domain-containing protein [Flavihumibacter rivuli]